MDKLILIADSSDSTTQLFRAYLKSQKYDVCTANATLEAYQAAKELYFDLILVGRLPNFTPFEFADVLLSGPAEGTPILLLVHKTPPNEDIEKLHARCCDYIISAPLDYGQLQQKAAVLAGIASPLYFSPSQDPGVDLTWQGVR
ncbi:DNA-binding response OmpR family regulator [Paenibacillus mucilaginosus]|uniref:hypothetical protein n=1 Tax=Paenibacillus mucilaginosus TaxID=61624 RepID=UPI003D1A3B84